MTAKDELTKSNEPSLRFGIMCMGYRIQRWQALCIRELLNIPDVEPALLIVPEKDSTNGKAGKTKQRSLDVSGRLYRKYIKLFVRQKAVHPEDLSTELRGVPTLHCKTIRKGKFSEYFNSEDLTAIQAYKLDFILRFAFGIIRGEILKSARYGVWSFHHGDEERYRGMPPGFWEIAKGDPVQGTILQRLTDRLDGGIVLKRAYYRTSKNSYRQNIDTAYIQSARMPAWVCKDIQRGLAEYLEAPPSRSTAPIYTTPTPWALAFCVMRQIYNRINTFYRTLFCHDHWNIGIIHAPVTAFLNGETLPPPKWLPAPPRGYFIADGFGLNRRNHLYLFYEYLNYEVNVGKLFFQKIGEDGKPSAPTQMMELPVHSAYPYVFEYEETIYCVPETALMGEIGLYKAINFPDQWEKVATLVDNFPGADATLFKYNGCWWMLAVDSTHQGQHELYIWYAGSPLGPWREHAGNPVKNDVRSSRPGGTPFLHKGHLYRPAQNCSKAYGGSLSITRVLELTPKRFREEVVTTIEPDPAGLYPDGLHTLSSVGNLTIVDGKRLRFSPSLGRQEFLAKLKRLLRTEKGAI